MKINFFLSDNEMAPTTISGKLFAKALSNLGYNVEIIQNTNKKKDILQKCDCDVIFFQKYFYEGHGYEDVKHLKGKVFLIYIDDDFLEMDDPSHKNALNIADLILVGNKEHVEKLKKYTNTPSEAVYTLTDFMNFPYTPFGERNNNPLIIYWEKNLADVYIDDLLMIKEPLTQLHEKYQIQLHLYGWHEGKHYGVPDNRPIVQNAFPFANFFSFQLYETYLRDTVPRIAKSDICIVPYLNIPERYGKTAFGLKHTMLLGVPIVASNFGIHQELITDGESGYLATTSEEWHHKIENLILHPELRKQFSLATRHNMETRYGYEACVNVLLDALKRHIPIF